jgi:putative transposase
VTTAEEVIVMRKSRFSEAQIIEILKQADAGMKVVDLCRRHGISDATFYKWRSRYGGLGVSEAV